MLLSKAAYARHRGVSKSAVSNWIKRGQIVLKGDKVDVERSDRLLAAVVDQAGGRDPKGKPANRSAPRPQQRPKRNQDDSRKARPAPATEAAEDTVALDVSDATAKAMAEERAGEIRERRIGQALKNAQLAGSLVPVEVFAAKLETLISGFCERLQSELRASAEALAKETDKREIRGKLDDLLTGVRSDFAERIAAGLAADDDDEDAEGDGDGAE